VTTSDWLEKQQTSGCAPAMRRAGVCILFFLQPWLPNVQTYTNVQTYPNVQTYATTLFEVV